MSGETEKAPSGWSVDTMKQLFDAMAAERLHLLEEKTAHLAEMAAERDRRLGELATERDQRYEQRFKAQEQAVLAALTAQKEMTAAALSAAEKAVLLAQANAKDWQSASNEWRGAMNDRERTLMPRTEAEKGMAANAEKIDSLAARIDRTEGRSTGLSAGWGYLVGAIGLVAGIIAIVTRL